MEGQEPQENLYLTPINVGLIVLSMAIGCLIGGEPILGDYATWKQCIEGIVYGKGWGLSAVQYRYPYLRLGKVIARLKLIHEKMACLQPSGEEQLRPYIITVDNLLQELHLCEPVEIFQGLGPDMEVEASEIVEEPKRMMNLVEELEEAMVTVFTLTQLKMHRLGSRVGVYLWASRTLHDGTDMGEKELQNFRECLAATRQEAVEELVDLGYNKEAGEKMFERINLTIPEDKEGWVVLLQFLNGSEGGEDGS